MINFQILIILNYSVTRNHKTSAQWYDINCHTRNATNKLHAQKKHVRTKFHAAWYRG